MCVDVCMWREGWAGTAQSSRNVGILSAFIPLTPQIDINDDRPSFILFYSHFHCLFGRNMIARVGDLR